AAFYNPVLRTGLPLFQPRLHVCLHKFLQNLITLYLHDQASGALMARDVVVVFPTPPFWLKIETVFPIITSVIFVII
ncbi:hypothetical protein RFX70_07460, partial [Acinetobacter baumannii]|nr:hypothetical protein [Acinetobacter baumannii]